MRRLFLSGLCLTLGLFADAARADDPWQTTRAASATGQAPARPQTLMRPVPLDEIPARQAPVTQASFHPAPEVRPLVRAKPFEQSQQPLPMPNGPAAPGGPEPGSGNGKIGTTGGPKPEAIAAPKVSSPDPWGTVVSRWSEGPTGYVGGDVPIICDPNCGMSCADACGPCAGGPRPLLGLLHGRWLGKSVCADPCGDPCGSCFDDPCATQCCLYGRAEYLMWWIKGYDAPPLVTSSPPGTPREAAGVLGQPGTTTQFGGNQIDYDVFSGGRFTLGFCLPNHPGCSFESTYFFLGSRSASFFAASNGSPILARPILNAVTGAEEAQLVAFPGVVVGSVSVRSESRLWGVEGNFRKQLCCGCFGYLDLLVGYRYLSLSESLDIVEDLNALAADPRGGAGTRIVVGDSFHTRNSFNGGQLGLEGERRFGRWFLGGSAKVALGVMHQTVSVNGTTTFQVPGAGTSVERGGILVLPTNIGERDSNKFAVIPEVGVRFGYQVTDGLRLFVGYNFLYASNVVRPGEQIDRGINKTQIPTAFGPSPLTGTPRPMPVFRSTDFWAQGINFGLELKY